MKRSILFLILLFFQMKSKANPLQKQIIKTNLGQIAVFTKNMSIKNTPIIFLHGVYLDYHLWDQQISEINDRPVIAIDMPWHGESTEGIPPKWTLDDCAEMLLGVLDSLKISKVMAVGHSWGSMTILRAAHQSPDKFVSVGFCNMPFEAISKNKKLTFRMQHMAIGFRKFYIKQAAKAMFGKETLANNPALADHLAKSMGRLSASQIRSIDQFVILNAENTSDLINQLKIPAMALKGKEDYVPTPSIHTKIVAGGHISPLEVPEDVLAFCREVISKSK